MRIGGFQKQSLIDYPGKIASIIFTIGCNFRCGFCHNPELQGSATTISEEHVLSYLEKNRKLLDAVVITGGEPTIQADLVSFIRRIKALGLLVKLDTNGTNPRVVRHLIDEKLVDYIAMDIKAPFLKDAYSRLVGVAIPDVILQSMKDTVALLIDSGVEHEFRTTLIRECHGKEDVVEMGLVIKGAQKYYLQQFRPGKTFDPAFATKTAYNDNEMLNMLAGIADVKETGVR